MTSTVKRSNPEHCELRGARRAKFRAYGLTALAGASLLLAVPLACAESDAFTTRTVEGQGGAGGEGGAPEVRGAGGRSTGGRSTVPASMGGEAGTSGAAGMGGTGEPEPPPPPPPPPEHRGCSIDAECAVFVKAGTNGEGTRTSPVGRITDGVAVAAERGKTHVFVCEGTYFETLAVQPGPEKVIVVGGLDCESWDLGGPSDVIADANSAAFEIKGREIEVERVSFQVPNAINGRSATGGYVIDGSLTLEDSSIIVGDGAPGVAPTWDEITYSSNTGNKASASKPGAAKTYCGSTGGRGGTIGGPAAGSGLPALDDVGGKAGQALAGRSDCYIGGPGVKGTDGAAVADGLGAQVVGKLVLDRWQGESGKQGVNGNSGQGGGGGGATMNYHGHGGSAGGCGGAGGRAGRPGGSSLGVVVVRSSFALSGVSIATGAGAAPSTALAGQIGQAGGPSVSGGLGCYGGAGGRGSDGGAGGGAAGGISVPVVHTADSTVTLNDAVLTPGVAGPAGLGGKPGVNDGVPGISAPTYQL
jgi:hypothetical protein